MVEQGNNLRTQERTAAIRKLQQLRGSDLLIAYITSTRPGLSAPMDMTHVRCFIEHIEQCYNGEKLGKVDLFIHSNGGDPSVSWRLMSLLREYAHEVDVIVPFEAFSAATLAALGANKIVMHSMGMLGPIDPTVHNQYGPEDPNTGLSMGVSVEDVASYIDLVKYDVGIRSEAELVQAFRVLAKKVHPLTLGSAKRATAQARMLGEKLLKLRDPLVDMHRVDHLVEQLTRKFYYHGHPINRREACDDLDLHIEIPSPEIESAIWQLFMYYENDLQLRQEFDPITVATNKLDHIVTEWQTVELPPMASVVIESQSLTSWLSSLMTVSVSRKNDGGWDGKVVQISTKWLSEAGNSQACATPKEA